MIHKISFNKWALLLFISSAMVSCVDLSGSSYREKLANVQSSKKNSKNLVKSPELKGEIHTMRGGLGIFSIGMNQLRDSAANRYHVPAYSTMWYNAGNVTRAIADRYYHEKEHTPVILIGHSLGANEQIKVARNLNAMGIPVALLVTVDAVSQTIVPPNVKHALNVYKPGYVPMFSGLKLRAVDPNATLIENVNVDSMKEIDVNHFTIDKDKIVQAMIMDRVEQVLTNGTKKA